MRFNKMMRLKINFKTRNMATRAEIRKIMVTALISKIKEENKATIDGKLVENIEITDVILIDNIEIISPEDIDRDDFEKAEFIEFKQAQIRVCINSFSSIFYCNGSSKVKYCKNDFEIYLAISRIYSR
jgi:hypothetical protein